MESPYSSLIVAMREEGAKHNGFDMMMCAVISVQPVSVRYNGVTISRNIYCYPAILGDDSQLEQILAGEPQLSAGFKSFLTDLYNKFKLSVGDMVVVQRVGNNFFVLGKVVKTG